MMTISENDFKAFFEKISLSIGKYTHEKEAILLN